ncbi:MAG: hypothetical protein K8R40_06390 [Anaerolineaceae bacterium]|nr:hypothetical protein [Anaerolineaceae bacterium]
MFRKMKPLIRYFLLIFIVCAGTLSACNTQNFNHTEFDLINPKAFAISVQSTIEHDISRSLELLTGTPEIDETKILTATLISETQSPEINNSATSEQELDVTGTQELAPSPSLSPTVSPSNTATLIITPDNNGVAQTTTKTSTPTTTPSNEFTRTTTKTIVPTATLTRQPPTVVNTNTSVPENTATFTPIPPTATTASSGCDWSGNSHFESSLISLINNERTNRGLGTLSVYSSLTTAARGHSQDMACNNFFSHTGSDGSSPFSRIIAAGYSYSLASENIYAGSGSNNSASAAFNAWMNSDDHRNNMLDSRMTHIGVGYAYAAASDYGGYVTANFGAP